MCAAACGRPCAASQACENSNSAPASAIAVAPAAVLAKWLLTRTVVRRDAMNASSAAATVAAAAPCSASSRKITMSPVAIECLLRGIWIGKPAASTASVVQPSTCHQLVERQPRQAGEGPQQRERHRRPEWPAKSAWRAPL